MMCSILYFNLVDLVNAQNLRGLGEVTAKR